ncbi:MAG TPA: GNAT family N-acetyltransferase [Solirubrobacteraceae bacterium]|jgi:RimJ/RimL family protein N-acetyltransferase|nr:GNAT family N-acetyltransferase [Solirubrobacteraceae bacterium]
MPSIPQPPDRIADALVELRPIEEWDIPEVLIAHQDDPELHRWLGLSRPPTGAQLGREVEDAQAVRQAGAGLKLTIVEPGSNDCRGRVEVAGIDWERGSATLRVWVVPELRGRGYEQRAAELAADWLRATVGLHELTVVLLA